MFAAGAVGGGGGASGAFPVSIFTGAITTGAALAVGRTISFGFWITTFFGGAGACGSVEVEVDGAVPPFWVVVVPDVLVELGSVEGVGGATITVTLIFCWTTVVGSITLAGAGGAAGAAYPSTGTTFVGFFGFGGSTGAIGVFPPSVVVEVLPPLVVSDVVPPLVVPDVVPPLVVPDVVPEVLPPLVVPEVLPPLVVPDVLPPLDVGSVDGNITTGLSIIVATGAAGGLMTVVGFLGAALAKFSFTSFAAIDGIWISINVTKSKKVNIDIK